MVGLDNKIFTFALLCFLLLPSFAWWNTSYSSRRQIYNSTFQGEIFWLGNSTNYYGIANGTLGETTYLYNDSGTYAVANDTTGYCFFNSKSFKKVCPKPPQHLLYYWSLDEASGDAWSSINTFNGTTNGVSYEATGKINDAYDFSEGDYVDFNDTDLSNFTISLWAKFDQKPTTMGADMHLISKGDSFQIRGDDSDDRITTYVYVDGWNNIEYTPTIVTGTWYHIVTTYDSENLTMYVNGVLADYDNSMSGPPQNSNYHIRFGSYNSASDITHFDGLLDEIRIYNTALTSTQILQIYKSSSHVFLGATETNESITYNTNVSYPYVNETVLFTATAINVNITDWWWNFNGTIVYTNETNQTHSFDTSGIFNVTLIGFDGVSTNYTYSQNINVYNRLSSVSLLVDKYLVFLWKENVTINYTATGGSPVLNSSLTIQEIGGTGHSYYNITSGDDFALFDEGETNISLQICDETDNSCVLNYTKIKGWNVTGGLTLIDSFNKTDRLLHQGFVGDTVTFSSESSLTWTLNETSIMGTSADLTFSNDNYYYSDTNYYHYNVSVSITWGSYTDTEWFTAISGRYTSGHDLSCSENLYCLIFAQQFCEVSCQQQVSDFEYFGTYELSDLYGHSGFFGVSTTDEFLNLSMCMNATAVLSHIQLDGTISYKSNSAQETSSIRTYAYQNASILLSSVCTTSNSKNYTFFAIPDSMSTAVTIQVLESGLAIPDALVKLQKYIDAKSSWVTVTSQITDINGEVQLEMELCPYYYKIIVEKDGVVLYDTSDPTCIKETTHIINVDTNLEEYQQIEYGVSSTCTYNNQSKYLECSVTDSSGAAHSSNLKVYSNWLGTLVCDVSETSTTTTLICDVFDQSDGIYSYHFYVLTSGKTYEVNTGQFYKGTKTDDYGEDGKFILYLLMSSVLIFAIKIPLMIPFVVILVMWGAYFMNLVAITPAVIGSLTAVGMIVTGIYWGRQK